jgi:ATP-dependent NAD(P)H-hydrate dehydratase
MIAFVRYVPKLSFSLLKGQCGKVGVVGGSLEYSGAPYFAASAVVHLGGDLSHIFCPPSANGRAMGGERSS